MIKTKNLFPIKVKRNYKIFSQSDFDHIQNGMCPEYALLLPFYQNAEYWDKGHDWIRGLNPVQSTIQQNYDIENNMHTITEYFENKYDKIVMSENELIKRKLLEYKMDQFLQNHIDFEENNELVDDTFIINICDELIIN